MSAVIESFNAFGNSHPVIALVALIASSILGAYIGKLIERMVRP